MCKQVLQTQLEYPKTNRDHFKDSYPLDSTRDYFKFSKLKGNRELDKKHLNELIRRIRERNLLHCNPILIDRKGRVIDGQHRIAAAMFLDLPIYYIVIPDGSIEDVKRLNDIKAQKSWSIQDRLNQFVIEGKPDYIKFNKILKDFPKAKLSTVSSLFTSYQTTKKFNDGDLVITKESEALVRRLLGFADTLFDILTWDVGEKNFIYGKYFMVALKYIFQAENFNEKTLLTKVKKRKAKIINMYSINMFVELLLDVYNFSNNKAINIKGFKSY